MSEVFPDVDSIANKSLTTLLRAVDRVGQNIIAKGCGVDDSTITNDKAKFWSRFARELALAGCKIVPTEARCLRPKEIEPLLELARQRMAQLTSIDLLHWDEPE